MSAKPVKPLSPFVERKSPGTSDEPDTALVTAAAKFRPAVGQRALSDEEIANARQRPELTPDLEEELSVAVALGSVDSVD